MKATLCNTCGYCPRYDKEHGTFCTFFGQSVRGITVIECIHYSEQEGD